jgi:hypothetical protein
VSQTKFGSASTKEIHGFARTLEGTVDPKLLDILVCQISKDALEFDWTRQELISRAAKLAYPIHEAARRRFQQNEEDRLAWPEKKAGRRGMECRPACVCLWPIPSRDAPSGAW